MSGYRFLLRRGTAAQWAAADPVLLDGEPGLERDTGRMKLGDGSTTWTDLPYVDTAGLAEKADAADVAASLATKANAATVGALSTRVDTTETRVAGVEDELPLKLDVTAANTFARAGADSTAQGIMRLLANPSTSDVILERVSSSLHYLWQPLTSGRRVRYSLESSSGLPQIRDVYACKSQGVTTSVDQTDPSVTTSGTWGTTGAGTPVAGTFGGSYLRSETTASYVEWTTATAAVGLSWITMHANNMGVAKVTIDGDATKANLLPTAQDYVNDGTLPSSVLVANGGTLNPTDRVYNAYRTTTSYNVTIPLADNLANTTHTVRLTVTGYKQAASALARVVLDGYTYTDNTSATWATEKLLAPGGRVWEYALALTSGGVTHWVGNSHGHDTLTSLSFTVDGVPRTLTDGQSVTGREIVATRVSALDHDSAGAAGTATTEYRLRADGLTITLALTFSKAFTAGVLEYPMFSVSSDVGAFTKGRTLAMDADAALTAHDGTLHAENTVSDTAVMWAPAGRWACAIHVPDRARTFGDDTMSVYIQDRAGETTAKVYYEHKDVVIAAGETRRAQSVIRFADLGNADLALAK